jgi:membrane associated rhomboid family serine protease
MATCYRHPSRETAVSCSSCGRPICPDCMTPTQVGMRCPECASQRTKVVRMRDMAAVPRATYALIAINVIVFLTEQGQFTLFSGEAHGSVYEKGALLGSSEYPPLAGQGVGYGQWWRIVTGGFLHENILHIGLNMWVLYILGQMLEPAIGSIKFLAIYVTSLLAGAFGALLITPHSLTVGASGAIVGLLGAVAVEMRARQISMMRSGVGGQIVFLLLWTFFVPGISVGGHVGGLIGGALAALAIQFGDRHRSRALALAGCAVIAAASVAGAVVSAKSSKVESVAPGQQLVPPGQ